MRLSMMTRSFSRSSLMRHFCRVFAPRMTLSEALSAESQWDALSFLISARRGT